MIRRLKSLLGRERRLRRKFARIGETTVLGWPRLLEGPSYISIGSRCLVRDGAWLGVFPDHPAASKSPPSLEIEDDVYVGFYACITSIGQVIIKQGSVISDYFYASDHTHGCDPRLGSSRFQPLASKGPVIIGENCLVGYRVSILPGTTLGKHCVIGAHSVVTRSFPPYSMIVGAPAKCIKVFDFKLGDWVSARSIS